MTIPYVYYETNAKSAIDDDEFVSSAIMEFYENCCIHKVEDRPHPLSAITSSQGKKDCFWIYSTSTSFYTYVDMSTTILLVKIGKYPVRFDWSQVTIMLTFMKSTEPT